MIVQKCVEILSELSEKVTMRAKMYVVPPVLQWADLLYPCNVPQIYCRCPGSGMKLNTRKHGEAWADTVMLLF